MDLVDFAKNVINLKKVKRAGWVRAGVKNSESVSDHSFSVAVMAMILGEKLGLDRDKLIKMALVHDLAESLTGDLILERGKETVLGAKKKYKLEEKAIKKIFSKIENGEEFLKLWKESKALKTREAKVLKQLDKLEMALQAFEYGKETNSKKLEEFWQNAQKYLSDPRLIKIFKEIKKN